MIAEARHGRLRVRDDPARGVGEERALRRKGHVARVAIEQPRAHRLLQAMNQLAERRLGEMTALGGPREAPAVGENDEGMERADG